MSSAVRRDLAGKIDPNASLAQAARTDGSATGTGVDTRGCGSVSIVGVSATVTDGTHVLGAQDSPDGSTDWQDIPAAQLRNSASFAAADDDTAKQVGIVQCRRWVRPKITTTGSTTGGVIGALVVRGDLERQPSDDADSINP